MPEINHDEVRKASRVKAVNAAKKFCADTDARTFGQNESAKTIVRLLAGEGYLDAAKLKADKGEQAKLFYLIHPLTNSAAMNRTMREEGVIEAAAADVLGEVI